MLRAGAIIKEEEPSVLSKP